MNRYLRVIIVKMSDYVTSIFFVHVPLYIFDQYMSQNGSQTRTLTRKWKFIVFCTFLIFDTIFENYMQNEHLNNRHEIDLK